MTVNTVLGNRLDLSGHVALVTGASGGLGAHFASTLAKSGASVVLAARRRAKLESVAASVRDRGGTAFILEMDITKPDSVNAGFAEIEMEFGRPCDIIVNNSGIGQNSFLANMEEDEWSAIWDTNLSGAWRVSRAAIAALKAKKMPGSIINIASILAVNTGLKIGAYSASKAALDHLTRNFALELARYNIRVNAIAPGYFQTDINSDFLNSSQGEELKQRVPLKRFGNYSELDAPLLMLAGDAGAFITGATLIVDGGHSLSPI